MRIAPIDTVVVEREEHRSPHDVDNQAHGERVEQGTH